MFMGLWKVAFVQLYEHIPMACCACAAVADESCSAQWRQQLKEVCTLADPLSVSTAGRPCIGMHSRRGRTACLCGLSWTPGNRQPNRLNGCVARPNRPCKAQPYRFALLRTLVVIILPSRQNTTTLLPNRQLHKNCTLADCKRVRPA